MAFLTGAKSDTLWMVFPLDTGSTEYTTVGESRTIPVTSGANGGLRKPSTMGMKMGVMSLIPRLARIRRQRTGTPRLDYWCLKNVVNMCCSNARVTTASAVKLLQHLCQRGLQRQSGYNRHDFHRGGIWPLSCTTRVFLSGFAAIGVAAVHGIATFFVIHTGNVCRDDSNRWSAFTMVYNFDGQTWNGKSIREARKLVYNSASDWTDTVVSYGPIHIRCTDIVYVQHSVYGSNHR